MMPLLSLALAGCAGLSPASSSTTVYLSELQPLLQENSLLAERVLFQAAAIYNEAAKPEQIANAWSAEIVPLSEHLANQAGFVSAPEPWSANHAELVEIWTDRAVAYRNLVEAIKTADADQWNTARAQADDVKLAEEKWFDALNEKLAPQGLVVDQYP
jgi:hypothetical protein